MKNSIFALAAASLALAACDDYLDLAPESEATPEMYFNDEASVEAAANVLYQHVLPGHTQWTYGLYGDDLNTDNMAARTYDGKFNRGEWRTSLDDSNWSWTHINTANYFLGQIVPKWQAGQISGNADKVAHYVGELYFFRAYEYFKLLRNFGDLPVIRESLPDDLQVLTDNSERRPRNEVARFILADLDTAYVHLRRSAEATTRVGASAAMLFKSRVALFEGSWLKNFAGTPFVPGSDGWPGAQKAYNAGFRYAAGSIEAEWDWFFAQAMEAARVVADAATLVRNTGVVPAEADRGKSLAEIEALNPWLSMFGAVDMSGYPEVLLWRQYNRSLGLQHNVVVVAQQGNQTCGTTRGMVDAFLTIRGLPIYDAASGYRGDTSLHNVRLDRDPRLSVLLKEPGQVNVLIDGNGDHATPIETLPLILQGDAQRVYTTGYALRKGNNYDRDHCGNGASYTGCPVFRSAEALINYIEACYERTGRIDATADAYWRALRARNEGMETDYALAIAATDMTREARGDWGAYTAGRLVDATLYNIRRERRCEFMAEGQRWWDLVRWRAMDQMTTTGYHVEGFHLWNTPMEAWYDAAALVEAGFNDRSVSEYLRPHEAHGAGQNGLMWMMAQYLRPIPIKQMMLTAPDGQTVADSPMYQNPYWPSQANMSAEQ